MPNPAWAAQNALIDQSEEVIALCIAIYRAVEVLAERHHAPEDEIELLNILIATAKLKEMGLTMRPRKEEIK
jgi:hypothetical protein